MSMRCEICGKGRQSGNKVSHAHNISKRLWLPNLQRVRAKVGGRVAHVRVCTRCIRSGSIVKAG